MGDKGALPGDGRDQDAEVREHRAHTGVWLQGPGMLGTAVRCALGTFIREVEWAGWSHRARS